MRDWVGDTEAESDVLFLTAPSQPPGLGGVEEGGAYMTISPQASEREHRQKTRQPESPPPQ